MELPPVQKEEQCVRRGKEADASADKTGNKAFSLIKRIFVKSPKVVLAEENKNVADTDSNASNASIPDKYNSTGFIDVVLEKTHVSSNLDEETLYYILKNNAWNSRCLHTKNFSKLPNTIDNEIYLFGERGSRIRARGEVQCFYKLQDEHVSNGTLFEDPEFPADDSSLFYSRRADRRYEWLRPGEICDDPQLFVEGCSRFDVQQGGLGDCWLLAAVASLSLYRRLFFQIVPEYQGFDENYAGIFHFRFWQYGRWIDVVIDDRLPTYGGQLVYLQSTKENEFWCALLQKAYAKLHGSYEALEGGSTCEAMEDFTGGITEMYKKNATPPNLFKILLKAYEKGFLMGCSFEPDPEVLKAETAETLIRGHAYSITRVKFVDIQTPKNVVEKIPLMRLRSPWGNGPEWNGPWSDKSPEWRYIPEHEKKELGLTFDHDGEFWMSFEDFQTYFNCLEICNITPDSFTEEEMSEGRKIEWEMSVFEGEWVKGITAGGCRNNLDTFWHNPQYRITLTDPDEGDDEAKCTVIVALMQKNRRSRKRMGVEVLTIGFAIYYLHDPDRVPKPLDVNYFKNNSSVARSRFLRNREVSCRVKLPPGTYCIVPSTFEPHKDGEFLLRVFSETLNNMEEYEEDIHYYVDKKVSQQTLTPAENQETDQVREFFMKLAGEDMEVDWKELKDILDYSMRNEVKNGGFSEDVCRNMVVMLDEDRSGKLGYAEFKDLWAAIRNWKLVFKMYDKDNSGALSGFELRQALNSAGYSLNNHILNILMHRYGNKSSELNFHDFISCAVKLKSMIEKFREKDANISSLATFSIEEWIETTLYT